MSLGLSPVKGRYSGGSLTSESLWFQVQHEARLSMMLLDSKAEDGFQLLLMTPKPMIRAFDHILQ